MSIFHSREFRGQHKVLIHFLAPYEKKLLLALLPNVPANITTAHLTLMTLAWSAGIVLSGYLAQTDLRWLWIFSACILLQYVTDMLDGAVGRARNTGLIKWGFYMDHFLDYVFLSSIVIGYSWLLPYSYWMLSLLCLMITAGFMVHAVMDFAVTNNFKISCGYFGVSEARLSLVALNVVLLASGTFILTWVFPVFVVAAGAALAIMVYRCQKIYSHLDAIGQAAQEDRQQQSWRNVVYEHTVA
ncbi:MAG: hypothetical protein JNN05_10300 [Candidatus Omnitrophica bacterium]|nr:hypothetical protein [Candidatus Omnitrophota bacterium]